jgi:glucose-1-phosphate cytidylyltransferase
MTNDFTIDLATGKVNWIEAKTEHGRVTVLDTGLDTLTGGRIKRARKFLENDRFCLAYGDGVSDVNITELVNFHKDIGSCCALTAVTQPGRYGALHLSEDGHQVRGFREKGITDGGQINGGFFVCQPEIFDLIDGDGQSWEEEPMKRLVEKGKHASFHCSGCWQSMDSLRDKVVLETIWQKGNAAWKVWTD